MYVYVNHTYLFKWSAPSCYLTTAFLNDCYSEVTAYTALGYSYWAIVFTMRMDAYITPTKDTGYSCYIKAIITYLTNHMESTYIMPHHVTSHHYLFIASRADRQTHTHAYRHSWTEAILRNQLQVRTGLRLECTWFRN